MKKSLICLSVAALTSCAVEPSRSYGDASTTGSASAVISSIGVYRDGNVGVQVAKINGNAVDMQRTASFKIAPGVYQISFHVNKDLRITTGNPDGGIGTRVEMADGIASLTAAANHTYIPNVRIMDNRIYFYFDDVGENYPTECLPLYRVINSSSNPGLKAHRTAKKCEI